MYGGTVSIVVRKKPHSEAFHLGQQFGDAFSIAQGMLEAIEGATIAAGGGTMAVLTSPTGIGAIAFSGVALGGLAMALHGTNTALNGADNLFRERKPDRLHSEGMKKEGVASPEKKLNAPEGPLEGPGGKKPGVSNKADDVTLFPKKLKPGTPEHKLNRWERYQKRDGKWDYERWSKQYDTNMENSSFGLKRENEYRKLLGGENKTVKTRFTNRQVDIYRPEENYMGQLKTGKVSLTEQAKLDIKKDAYLVKKGKVVEYILEKGASKNFIEALERAGIKYHIGPKIP